MSEEKITIHLTEEEIESIADLMVLSFGVLEIMDDYIRANMEANHVGLKAMERIMSEHNIGQEDVTEKPEIVPDIQPSTSEE